MLSFEVPKRLREGCPEVARGFPKASLRLPIHLEIRLKIYLKIHCISTPQKNNLSWQINKNYYRLKKLRLYAELLQSKNLEDLTLCLNPCGDAMPPSGVHSVSFPEFLSVLHHKNQTIFRKTYNVKSQRIFMQVIKHNPRELLKLLLLVNNSLPKPYWTSAQVCIGR